MKHLLLSLGILVAITGFAQEKAKLPTNEINWMTIEEAQEATKKEPRKIIMDVYTKWCGPCKMMMKYTFTSPQLIDYINDNYYAVKFDAESPDEITFRDETFANPDYVEGQKGRNGVHKFSRFLQIRAYPSIVYLDEDLNVLTVDVGYKTAPDVEKLLKFFKDDLHKVEDPQSAWDKFSVDFKPTFVQTPKD